MQEDPRADLGVAPHLLPLGVAERAGLVEDRVGDPELAEIVQDAGRVDALDPLGASSSRAAVSRANVADGARVVGRCRGRAGRGSRPAASRPPVAAPRTDPVCGRPAPASSRRTLLHADGGVVDDRHQVGDLLVAWGGGRWRAGRPTPRRGSSRPGRAAAAAACPRGASRRARGAALVGGVQSDDLVTPLRRPGGQPDGAAGARTRAQHRLPLTTTGSLSRAVSRARRRRRARSRCASRCGPGPAG